jgi:hypothetical protein
MIKVDIKKIKMTNIWVSERFLSITTHWWNGGGAGDSFSATLRCARSSDRPDKTKDHGGRVANHGWLWLTESRLRLTEQPRKARA